MLENIPADEELVTFAIDGSGEVFTVGYVTNGFGQQQIRADKIDSSGNSLGTFEFGTVSGLLAGSVAGAAVDPNGNLVIVGSLNTTGLITIGSTQAVFVIKIDSQLKTILSSTTLGATGPQHVFVFTMAGGPTIDRSGNIYVTGQTSNPNFPVTTGAFQTQLTAEMNGTFPTYAFVTKIASDGKTIVFSTFFGSASVPCDPASDQCPAYVETNGSAIAVDAAGDVIIAGYTNASGLPFPAGALSSSCGNCGEDASGHMSYAGFVAKFSADGTKLLAGTYVPVSATGQYCNQVGIGGLALDGAGNIVVSGLTSSVLPVTPGAVQTAFPDTSLSEAGFVLKLDPSAGHLVFGTYFGGAGVIGLFGYGAVGGVAVDTQGTIWLTGASPTADLPAPEGTPLLGGTYLAGLSADGSTLSALFTAPQGFAGLAIASTASGIVALGPSGALLTAAAGAGPSLVGITNSAGFAPSTSIAPYELVSLYGLGIGPSTPVSGSVVRGVVSDSLSGFQVLFNGAPAPLLYAGPTQINALVPSEVVNSATATVEIVTPSGTLAGPAIPVSPSQPGVVLSAQQPEDALLPVAVALNQDGTVNSAANPAALGSIISVWVSGAGLSTYPVPDGTVRTGMQIGQPTLPVVAFAAPLFIIPAFLAPPAGALSTEVVYAGDAAGMVAGVTQVNLLIPSQVQEFGFSAAGFPYDFWLEIGGASSEQFTIYTADSGVATPVIADSLRRVQNP